VQHYIPGLLTPYLYEYVTLCVCELSVVIVSVCKPVYGFVWIIFIHAWWQHRVFSRQVCQRNGNQILLGRVLFKLSVSHSHGADSYMQDNETAESGSGPQTRTNLQAFLILQYVLSKVCFSCYTDLIGVW